MKHGKAYRKDHPPSTHEVARRAQQSASALLSRDDVEREYNLSRRWLELAALNGGGPPMVRLSRRMVRYRRDALEAWLDSRTVTSTSQEVAA